MFVCIFCFVCGVVIGGITSGSYGSTMWGAAD